MAPTAAVAANAAKKKTTKKRTNTKQTRLADAPPKAVGVTKKAAVQAVLDSAELRSHIVSFLNIPSLGRCARVSKGFQASVMEDSSWSHHLKRLLRKVFDNAFYIEPKERGGKHTQKFKKIVPISKRPLQSTNFLQWRQEWFDPPYWTMKSDAVMEGIKYDDGTLRYWLARDVPLRTYYKEAGHYAWLGQQSLIDSDDEEMDEMDLIDYDGVYLGVNERLFQGLPRIRLFQGVI